MKALNFIHIGKCGGGSIRSVLSSSTLLSVKYSSLSVTHVSRPVYKSNHDYLIIIRNPLLRAVSAFKWRYRLVVCEETQRNRFPNEYNILKRYKSFGQMAELLYDNGKLNRLIASELLSIHHIRENISFYLSDLLQRSPASQIIGVICQETLSEDCERILGARIRERIHYNGGSDMSELSYRARLNALHFFAKDYKCIFRLYMNGNLPEMAFNRYFLEGMHFLF